MKRMTTFCVWRNINYCARRYTVLENNSPQTSGLSLLSNVIHSQFKMFVYGDTPRLLCLATVRQSNILSPEICLYSRVKIRSLSVQRRGQTGHQRSSVMSEFPNLGFLSCNAHYCLSRYHLTLTVTIWLR